jgi:hypothetical protein
MALSMQKIRVVQAAQYPPFEGWGGLANLCTLRISSHTFQKFHEERL